MIKTTRFLRQSIPVALFSMAVLLIVIQLGPQCSMAESEVIKMPHVGSAFPFYDTSGTYIFGLEPSGGDMQISNAANWWRINDDPSTGFRPVVRRAKMSSGYGYGLGAFTLNNHPYLFGLRVEGANFWRINDDPATGFRLVNYKEKMSVHYVDVVFFQLKGKSYMLGLHADKGANIWQLTEEKDGRVKLNLVKYGAKMAERYRYLKVFYIDRHPYIFGLHRDVGANIWRVNDDPSKGLDLVMYGQKFHQEHDFVHTFHLNGRPYLYTAILRPTKVPEPDKVGLFFAIAESIWKGDWSGFYEEGEGYAVLWEFAHDPKGALSIRKVTPKAITFSHRYDTLTTFEQGGKAYIFGVHKDGFANIWQVNEDPTKGFSLIYYGKTGKSINQIVGESKPETR